MERLEKQNKVNQIKITTVKIHVVLAHCRAKQILNLQSSKKNTLKSSAPHVNLFECCRYHSQEHDKVIHTGAG